VVRLALAGQLQARSGRLLWQCCAQLLVLLFSLLLVLMLSLLLAETRKPHQASPTLYQWGQQVWRPALLWLCCWLSQQLQKLPWYLHHQR
jgi:hypothetical protein